jgi:hypothetical protein
MSATEGFVDAFGSQRCARLAQAPAPAGGGLSFLFGGLRELGAFNQIPCNPLTLRGENKTAAVGAHGAVDKLNQHALLKAREGTAQTRMGRLALGARDVIERAVCVEARLLPRDSRAGQGQASLN